MEMSVQIRVSDEVRAVDVFVSNVKKWAKKIKEILPRAITLIFHSNSYSNWKALPVRGPDVKVSIYTSMSGNF